MIRYWNKIITIYNRDTMENGKVLWHRHQIPNCFAKITRNRAVVGAANVESNGLLVRIPQQKTYKNPIIWAAQAISLRKTTLTLQPGDLVVIGSVDDEIDEYITGKRSSDILAKYAAVGSMLIKSVTINVDLPVPHYKVEGE